MLPQTGRSSCKFICGGGEGSVLGLGLLYGLHLRRGRGSWEREGFLFADGRLFFPSFNLRPTYQHIAPSSKYIAVQYNTSP